MSERRPERVGRVLGSEHASTSAFRVVLDDDDYLQLDDLVVVRTQVPKAGEVRTYGVVTEAEAVYEGASFESDTHRIAELGIMPAAKVRTARVAVTRVDPEVWVSPDPGEPVERAAGEERDKALYVDEMGRPLPVGHRARRRCRSTSTSTSSTGARAATCRSAASAASPPRPRSRCSSCGCSPRSPRHRGRGCGEPARARVQREGRGPAVARQAQPRSSTTRRRARLGRARASSPAPFPSVCFWAPPRRRSGDVVLPDTGGRQEGVEVFTWTPREFIDEDLLQFLLHRRERRSATSSRSSASACRRSCRRFAVDVAGHARRGGAPRPARRARRLVAGPGRSGVEAGERIITDLAVARGRARRVPGARGRRRARRRVERPRDGRHGLARSCAGCTRRAARLGHLVRAGESRRIDRGARERHRRRDPVAARPGAALRRRRAPERDVRARRRRRASACRSR